MFKFANLLPLPLLHTNNNNRQVNSSLLLLLLGSMNQIEHFTIQCNKYNTIINKYHHQSANSEIKTIIINGSDNCENALLQFSFSSTLIQSLSRGFEEYPIYNKKKNIHYYSNSASSTTLLLKGFTNIINNRRFYHQCYHQNNKDNRIMASTSEYSNTSSKMVEQLFRGVWNTEKEHKHIPYHLIENMYHSESGLYSEGCWHNFVMGLNMFYLLKNEEFNEFCKENNVKEKLSKLSQAVFKLNFDTSHGLFYQRQASGIWQTSDESIMEERREFWKTNKEEKKLISNTMGLLFYATIGQEFKPEDLDLNKFCEKIIDDFYDSEKQMWSTKILPKGHQVHSQHYRLVDHSLLYLALKRVLSSNTVDQSLNKRVEQVVDQVLEVILKKFKVETSERITYYDDNMVPHTKKFLWQDCWLAIALIASKKHHHLIPQLIIEMQHDYLDEDSGLLFNESYGSIQDKSTIQIKIVGENQKRKISPNSHQMYISFINDNALFYFILKNRHIYLPSDNTEIAHKIEELWNQTHASFSNYIEMSKVKHDANTNEQRLLVSDYLKRQGLWANSEVIWTLLATFDELN